MLFYKKFYPLTFSFYKGSGRNLNGQITSWSRRTVQFRLSVVSYFVCGLFKILSCSINHRQSSVLALSVNYQGLLSYQRLPLKLGLTYLYNSFRPSLPLVGVQMPLKWIPVGIKICGVKFYARAPGSVVQLLRHRLGLTQCKLPSKRLVWVHSKLLGLIGQNGQTKVKHQKFKLAGDRYWLGKRPRVRGVAMNPVDHPHGGGQGKTSGGRPGCSPWGQLTKGYRSRPKHHHGLIPPKIY